MRVKRIISKIWFPVAVAAVAFGQSFGMNPRAFSPPLSGSRPDTVIYNAGSIFTKFRDSLNAIMDSTYGDSMFVAGMDTIIFARDTMKIPDSLQYTDPFRYKYYVALVDSFEHKYVVDTLKAFGDSIDWPKVDSIYYADSAIRAKAAFEAWYNSLDPTERKKYDFQKKMEARQHRIDSILNAKDSIKSIRDSIFEAKPRILETFSVPESEWYKRIITWNKGEYFNEVKLHELDTSYNYYFNDYTFMREDINATYLGIVGSPVLTYDFFKRKSREGVSFYEPYETYSFSPYTLPMFNTKTAYTELAYWGTLFADTQNEETDIHLMTTQNILPELNFTLGYDRVGANGLLDNETTDNRTFYASVNYLGKRYQGHVGYIYNKIERDENGGMTDSFWIRDTTVGPREIPVYLDDATTLIKKNTVFLDQTLRIPFTFLRHLGDRAEKKADMAYRDSILATGDSLMIAIMEREIELRAKRRKVGDDELDTDITTAYIGHNSEYSVYRKLYTDEISASDTLGRQFYNDNFYLNPTESADSIRVMKFENKFFIKLQPWADDAIVSTLNVGIGDRLLNYYMFTPGGYLTKPSNDVWNSLYIYGGVGGRYRKLFTWEATGYFTFAGDESGDFGVFADATMQIYPFRKARRSPLTVNAHFETTLDEPEYFEQHYFSNHYQWENSFEKKSVTKIEGSVSIPYWNLYGDIGYSLLNKNIYYDTEGIVQQNTSAMSVFKASLRKDFVPAKWFHLENKLMYQVSSNEDVLPLPEFSANLRWYLQLNINKQHTKTTVMNIQLGANLTYTSAWYAPAFNPAVGVFHNQTDEKYGDCPYIDLFANIRWKRADIFVKYLNAAQGWPRNKKDYFSAAGYIRPETAIKFGIFWPFYMQPAKLKGQAEIDAAMGLGASSSSGTGTPAQNAAAAKASGANASGNFKSVSK